VVEKRSFKKKPSWTHKSGGTSCKEKRMKDYLTGFLRVGSKRKLKQEQDLEGFGGDQ